MRRREQENQLAFAALQVKERQVRMERGGGGGEGGGGGGGRGEGGGGGGAFLMGDQQQLSFPSRLGLHPILAHQRFCLADLQLCMIDGGLFSKLVVRCSTSKFPPLYNFNCKAIYHLPMQLYCEMGFSYCLNQKCGNKTRSP